MHAAYEEAEYKRKTQAIVDICARYGLRMSETNGGPLIPTSEELVQLVKRRTPKGRARRS